MNAGTPDTPPDVAVRAAVVNAIVGKLAAAGAGAVDIDEKRELLELGFIDSEDLVELILDIERQCGCEFNPEELNFETGLTIESLAAAFVVSR